MPSMTASTDIQRSLYEYACEPSNNCNNDQFSFKAYMSRWLAKSAVVAPYILSEVRTLLTTSALAAAQSCSGGSDGTTCGEKWYVNGYDGIYGVGQELSALETIQSLLVLQDPSRFAPLHQADVVVVNATSTSMFDVSTATATPASSGSSAASAKADANAGARTSVSLMPAAMSLAGIILAGVLGT
jgi:mannan endo-1,6-alpha-mannosidase